MSLIRKCYNLFLSSDKAFARALYQLTGIVPRQLTIYFLAFKHSSVYVEVSSNNERLELLGDAVLDLIVSDYLFHLYPLKTEGFLTEMKAKIVSRHQLNRVAVRMGLSELVQHRESGAELEMSSILGNALEALVGAVYIDRGYDKAKAFVINKILKTHFDLDELRKTTYNFKSKLLEWSQKENVSVSFEILEEKKEKHKKIYKVGLYINGKLEGTGKAMNKKKAEQRASEVVFNKLGLSA